MGYADLKSSRQRDAERIRELERELKRERASHASEQPPERADTATPHVTVERTAKRFKKAILICWAAIILGVIFISIAVGCIDAGSNSMWFMAPLGGLTIICAVINLIIIKFRIWWNHG